MQPLTTARLIVRSFRQADWPAVLSYTGNPAVMTYLPEGVFNGEAARAFVTQNEGESARAFGVELRQTGQLIGHISFHPWFGNQTYEIGWVFHPDFYGQGLATEAANAMIQFGFETLHLHRIIATCQPENPASQRVMEKIGMRREGHFKQCIYRGNNVWWDEYFYAILAQEWAHLAQKS